MMAKYETSLVALIIYVFKKKIKDLGGGVFNSLKCNLCGGAEPAHSY